MALIFTDHLQTTDTGGLYTLRGYVNDSWQDVHTIAGPQTGTIDVDAPQYYITVDTDIFLPGTSYYFKWVDIHGVESNMTVLQIPASEFLDGEDSALLLVENSDRIILS